MSRTVAVVTRLVPRASGAAIVCVFPNVPQGKLFVVRSVLIYSARINTVVLVEMLVLSVLFATKGHVFARMGLQETVTLRHHKPLGSGLVEAVCSVVVVERGELVQGKSSHRWRF